MVIGAAVLSVVVLSRFWFMVFSGGIRR